MVVIFESPGNIAIKHTWFCKEASGTLKTTLRTWQKVCCASKNHIWMRYRNAATFSEPRSVLMFWGKVESCPWGLTNHNLQQHLVIMDPASSRLLKGKRPSGLWSVQLKSICEMYRHALMLMMSWTHISKTNV